MRPLEWVCNGFHYSSEQTGLPISSSCQIKIIFNPIWLQLPSLLINSVEYFTITLTSAVLVNLLPSTWLLFCIVLFSVERQSPEFDQKLLCSENNKQSYFLHLGTIICQSILKQDKGDAAR